MLQYFRNCVRMGSKIANGVFARHFSSRTTNDQGAAIVEMALVSSLLCAMLIGIFQISMTLYSYEFVTEAARDAARWAIVRGSQCSTNTKSLDHCGASSTDIQNYVNSLGFPYAGSLTASATWCNVSVNAKGQTVWTTPPCTGANAGTNDPGNIVSVVVSISLPLNVPFLKKIPMTMTSTSNMTISQ